MKISKPTLIFLALAVVMLIYLVFFSGPKKTLSPPVQKPIHALGQQILPLLPAAKAKAAPRAPAFDKEPLAWDRDPFLLPKAPERKGMKITKTALRLTAILDGSSGRVAILDSEVVRKGDIVGGEKVAEIGKDRVVLMRENTRRVLVLEEPVWAGSEKDGPPKDGKKTGDKVVK